MQSALETPPEGEAEHTEALIALLGARMSRDYPTGTMRRDAHPKHHGLTRATLAIEPGLPPELAVGLFARPAVYSAWVRYSNANIALQPDRAPDVRGIAIKLMGVPGPKLLPGSEADTTHDFLLVTAERFMVPDVAGFFAFMKALTKGRVRFALHLLFHPCVAFRLFRSLRAAGSVLDVSYSSMTPYLLGGSAVRYGLRPHTAHPAAVPASPSPDFLRQELRSRLAAGDAAFDLLVQIRTDPRTMPIEDATVAWSEARAPYHKVATLRIPAQVPDTDARMRLAEDLSFNPWRCLAEHRPLGGINRARKAVYAALSGHRHTHNRAPQREPSEHDPIE